VVFPAPSIPGRLPRENPLGEFGAVDAEILCVIRAGINVKKKWQKKKLIRSIGSKSRGG